MGARMGCGVSDLSHPEITFIAHGIYLYLRTARVCKM